MAWPFRKPTPEEPVPVRFSFDDTGLYHAVFEKKPQPDVGGARIYAWESLGLAEFTPIGPATARRGHWLITAAAGEWFPAQQLLTNGVPTNAGQLGGQPLFDESAPGTGFASPDLTMGLPSTLRWNDVAMFGYQDRINDPNPINRRGV